MRLGVFGGSFNPVHYGHLLLAESCREQCHLDEVWLLPAASPPHKQDHSLAEGKHRLAMLELALGGHPQISASDRELQRGGVSYTIDTLEDLQQSRPEAELFFLMGADSLVELPTWRAPERICTLATPVAVRRAGAPEPSWEPLRSLLSERRIAELQAFQVEMPLIGLSSTAIRAAIAEGRSVRFQTPRAVEKYIETHRLYGSRPRTPLTCEP